MLRLTHRDAYRRRPDLKARGWIGPDCDQRLRFTLGTTRIAGADVALCECLACGTLLAVHSGRALWEVAKPKPYLPPDLLDAMQAAPLPRTYTQPRESEIGGA